MSPPRLNTPAIRRQKKRHPNQTPPALTRSRQRLLLERIAATGQIKRSCLELGIDLQAPFRWATTSAQFAKRLEDAQAKGEKVILAEYEHQIDKRAFVGAKDPQSAVLTMFRVKRLDPRYRENAAVQVNLAGPVAIALGLDISSNSNNPTYPQTIPTTAGGVGEDSHS